MTGNYSKAKTVVKGAEAPVLVILVAALIKAGMAQIDAPLDADKSLAGAACLYGLWKGLMNWFKNRRRR